MPRLAAFPKAFMQALCKDGTMTVSEWISLAANLEIEGLEWYAGFLEMEDPANWSRFRKEVEDHGMVIPMMCCSPDFTHPDPAFRENEIAKQKHWIEMTQWATASRTLHRGGHHLRQRFNPRVPPSRCGTWHHSHHRKPLQRRLLELS